MTQATNELSREEFEATLSPVAMVDVTATAEEVVALWPYAEAALRTAFPSADSSTWNVEHIYESHDGSFQHVLIPSRVSNIYAVIVIDKVRRQILGFRRLDLGELYGLRDGTSA